MRPTSAPSLARQWAGVDELSDASTNGSGNPQRIEPRYVIAGRVSHVGAALDSIHVRTSRSSNGLHDRHRGHTTRALFHPIRRGYFLPLDHRAYMPGRHVISYAKVFHGGS